MAEAATGKEDFVKPRTLIIGARNLEDFIRAGRLVRQYERDGYFERKAGRNNLVVYTTKGFNNPGAVWHNAQQITVHMGNQNGTD